MALHRAVTFLHPTMGSARGGSRSHLGFLQDHDIQPTPKPTDDTTPLPALCRDAANLLRELSSRGRLSMTAT